MSDTTVRDVSPDEFTHLRELAAALRSPRLVPSWVRELEARGQLRIPRSLYVTLTTAQKHDVDVVVNDLPFGRTGDDTGLTLSFNQVAAA